jgi:ketosteroid isomerase-like protein
MKRAVLFVLLIFMLTALVGLAQSSPDATAGESKILALENAWGQAEKSNDSKALDSLLDDSLVYIRYDGSVWSKSKYLASLNDHSSHEEQAVNENMTAHIYGDAALVTGIYRVKGVEQGKPYSRRERFIDTWVRRNDGWICVASQVTLIGH